MKFWQTDVIRNQNNRLRNIKSKASFKYHSKAQIMSQTLTMHMKSATHQ
jgi:hypothetical protein